MTMDERTLTYEAVSCSKSHEQAQNDDSSTHRPTPSSSSESTSDSASKTTITANRHQNLSAYNYYMKYHRTVLVTPGRSFDALDPGLTFDQKRTHILQALDDDPYRLRAGEKRLHRTSHGAVGFKELTRQVSAAWRSLDDGTRSVFQDIAREANRISREQHQQQQAQGGEGEKNTTTTTTTKKKRKNTGKSNSKAAKKKRKVTTSKVTEDSSGERARSTIVPPTTTTIMTLNEESASNGGLNGRNNDDGPKSSHMEELLQQQFALARRKIASAGEQTQQGTYHPNAMVTPSTTSSTMYNSNISNNMLSAYMYPSSASIVSNGLPGSVYSTGGESSLASMLSMGTSSSSSLPFYHPSSHQHNYNSGGGNASWYQEQPSFTGVGGIPTAISTPAPVAAPTAAACAAAVVTAAPSRNSYASSTASQEDAEEGRLVDELLTQAGEKHDAKSACNAELTAFLTNLDWSKL